jgi:hypothetical protein
MELEPQSQRTGFNSPIQPVLHFSSGQSSPLETFSARRPPTARLKRCPIAPTGGLLRDQRIKADPVVSAFRRRVMTCRMPKALLATAYNLRSYIYRRRTSRKVTNFSKISQKRLKILIKKAKAGPNKPGQCDFTSMRTERFIASCREFATGQGSYQYPFLCARPINPSPIHK